MEIFGIMMAVALLSGALVLSSSLLHRGFRRQVADAAAHHGLTIQPPGARPTVLEGDVRGRHVRVAWLPRAGGAHGQFEITIAAKLPPGTVLRRETARSRAFRPDVQLGVPELDDLVHISLPGSPHDLLSRLGAPARLRLTEALDFGPLRTGRGAVTAHHALPRRQRALGHHIAALVAAVEALEDDRTTAARLADNALHDPNPGYRLRCFELATLNPDTEAARGLARACLDHEDLLIRVRAAGLLRDDAGERALNAVLANPRTPADARAEALDALAAQARPPRTELLVEHLAVDAAPVRATAARCLGLVGTAGAISALLPLLEDDEVTVRTAALAALGACATPAAIEALEAHTQGVLRDATEKRAAREAIARIQHRYAGGTGRLSVVGAGREGALAMTPEGEPRE